MFDRRRKNETLPRLCVVVLALSVPPVLWLWDLSPEIFAGCDAYGYGCPEVACFGLEVTTDQGATWRDGGLYGEEGVYIFGWPGSTTLVHTRSLLGVISGELDGWQFGVRHDGSAVTGAAGAFDLVAVQEAQFPGLKCGAPPDFRDTTQIRPCGYTQGIVIDMSSNNPPCTVGAPAEIITSYACYRVTFPTAQGVYSVTLSFTDDVGDPPVRSVVTQGGASKLPCKYALTLKIYSTTYYYPTPSYCPLNQQTPLSCSQGGGGGGAGAPGTDFTRADSNADGSVNLSDPVYSLNALFRDGPDPGCLDAADANDDEAFDMSDAVFTLYWLFRGGGIPPAPGPTACGPDLTDELVAVLDCQQYASCDGTDTDGDGLTDSYEGQIGTDPNLLDTDGDNFEDGQEVLPTGVPGCNGGALNISKTAFGFGPQDGADPLVRDIFVEIDYMVAPDHSHLPMTNALQDVVAAFANRNVALHLDTGTAPFDLGGGNALAHQTNMSFGYGNPTFEGIKANNFDDINRCNVFHYNVWAHNLRPAHGSSSGIADIPGDDFIVSLGSWANQVGTRLQQAGTFMHELGHNLNLLHGGNQDTPWGKPNYRSVMSYRYQVVGVDTNCDAIGDGLVDYSDEVLPTLNENCLDENAGICGNVPINWNGDGQLDNCVQWDITCDSFNRCDGVFSANVTSFNDWVNYQLFMNSGQGGGGGEGASGPCLTAP